MYVDTAARIDVPLLHPTWTHGQLLDRILSGITRAELVRHGTPYSAARRGEDVRSPRVRTAMVAWRDCHQTATQARRDG